MIRVDWRFVTAMFEEATRELTARQRIEAAARLRYHATICEDDEVRLIDELATGIVTGWEDEGS